MDAFYITIEIFKLFFIFFMMFNLVPFLVWLERRGSAFIQNRFGPNRVGPWGLIQTLADAVKFAFKEEFVPPQAKKVFFYAAPVLALIPGVLAFAAIPFASALELDSFSFMGQQWGPYTIYMQGYHFGVGLVFVLAVSSLSTYSILLAGWSSGNKFSLMGALRSSAQMISYELGLGLALVGLLLVFGTFDFSEFINMQKGPLAFHFMGKVREVSFLPNWGIFYQPFGFLLFFVCVFAESNRMPFDLPEAEAELVAGYHTEYGGLKMLLFYVGEYAHMMVGSALAVSLYFGGFELPHPLPQSDEMASYFMTLGWGLNQISLLVALMTAVIFFVKVMFFMWVFIWVRWTLPRFKYDQLMKLGWKKILPWALFNTFLTAFVCLLAHEL